MPRTVKRALGQPIGRTNLVPAPFLIRKRITRRIRPVPRRVEPVKPVPANPLDTGTIKQIKNKLRGDPLPKGTVRLLLGAGDLSKPPAQVPKNTPRLQPKPKNTRSKAPAQPQSFIDQLASNPINPVNTGKRNQPTRAPSPGRLVEPGLGNLAGTLRTRILDMVPAPRNQSRQGLRII